MNYFFILVTSSAVTLVLSAGVCETHTSSPCVEGCYYEVASGQCAEVPAGYFSPKEDDNLYACPPGTVSWFPGSGSCLECGIGEYAANRGSIACLFCNPKYYFGPGSTHVLLENGEIYCQPRIEAIVSSGTPSYAQKANVPSFFSTEAPSLRLTSGTSPLTVATFQPATRSSGSPIQIPTKPSVLFSSSKPFSNSPPPSKAPAFRNVTVVAAPTKAPQQHPVVLPNFWPRSSPPSKSNSSAAAVKKDSNLNPPVQDENEIVGTFLQYLPFMITALLLVCIGCMYRRVKPKKTRSIRKIPPPPPNAHVFLDIVP